MEQTSVVTLIKYPNNCWHVADVVLDGKLIKAINKFYQIDKEWIYEFDSFGSSGTGYTPGDLIWKFYIGDKNFRMDE